MTMTKKAEFSNVVPEAPGKSQSPGDHHFQPVILRQPDAPRQKPLGTLSARDLAPLFHNGTAEADPGSGTWLVLADREGLGKRLIARLRAQGQSCIAVEPGEAYECLGQDRYRIDPRLPGDFVRLLGDVWGDTPDNGQRAAALPPCHGIVHLWSLDSTLEQTAHGGDLQEAQLLGCGAALHLVQSLQQSGWENMPQLYFELHRKHLPILYGMPRRRR